MAAGATSIVGPPHGRDMDGDRSRKTPAERPAAPDGGDDVEELAELLEDLDELEEMSDSPEEREKVRETRRHAIRTVRAPATFGRVIRGFDRSDAAEALLGSVLFGIPMMVEDGTFAVGEYVAAHPPYFAGTALFGIAMVVGILYVADIQDVQVHEPLLGVVPRRLVGVLAIALVTATALATAWGRVDWADPTVAFAQVVVAAVPMAIGGALGDILPGS